MRGAVLLLIISIRKAYQPGLELVTTVVPAEATHAS